jgi:hypothetical protein
MLFAEQIVGGVGVSPNGRCVGTPLTTFSLTVGSYRETLYCSRGTPVGGAWRFLAVEAPL